MQNVRVVFAGGCLALLAACDAGSVTRPDDVSAAPSGTAAYVASALPLPAFSTMGVALAVNDSGWIVGWTDSVGGFDGGRAPTLWRPSQAPVRLPAVATFSQGGGYAADINNRGDIVGVMGGFGNPFGSGRAWNWRGTVTVTPSQSTIPASINLSGSIAADTCSGYCNATRFARAFTGGPSLACLGTPTTFGGCIYGHAASINDAGWVVGTYKAPVIGAVKHAVIWDASGAVTELPFYGAIGDSAAPTHINNTRTVSGYTSVFGVAQPIAWYATGAAAFIAPGYAGIATSVSDKNRVVGTVVLTTTGSQPFTSFSPSTFTLLPLLRGAVSGTAEDVNSCGVIVGSAVIAARRSVTVPVVWRPVPADACDSFAPPPVNVRVSQSGAAAPTNQSARNP